MVNRATLFDEISASTALWHSPKMHNIYHASHCTDHTLILLHVFPPVSLSALTTLLHIHDDLQKAKH